MHLNYARDQVFKTQPCETHLSLRAYPANNTVSSTKMVAAAISPTISSLSQVTFNTTKYGSSSVSSFAALRAHELFSLVNLTETSRIEIGQCLASLGSRPINRFIIKCSYPDSPINLQTTETETVKFLQGMGLNREEIRSLLEKNAVLRLTPFDKLRDRVLCLQSIGIKGIALYNLIIKNPNVLVAEEIEPLICFIRYDLGGKIEPLQLEQLFSSTETRFLVGFDRKVRLLIQHGVSEEKLVHVLNHVNLSKALCNKSVEEIEKMIEFLKPFGGIDLIVRHPVILDYDLEAQLIPRIGVIKELSGNDLDGTDTVLTKFPMILSYSAEHVNNREEIESLLEKNPVLRVTPFDKLHDRVLCLESIGIKGIALYNLMMKNPNVLVVKEIEPLICFIRCNLGGKIEPLQLERLFSSTETRFLVGFDRKVRLLIQHGLSEEKLVHVLNHVNLSKALCNKSVEEIEKMIEFLKPFGGIDLIVRRPVILNYDLEAQLIPRIGVIKELSGNDLDGTGTVLMKFPMILNYSVKHVKDHIEVLRSFAGLSDEEIFKIFLIFPGLISTSRERKLHPRIDFLKQCGLDSEDIAKFLTKAPLFLALSFENIEVKLAFLVKIGYRYRQKELAIALGAVTRTSCENMQKVIELFLSYGLSLTDIHVMSKKHPQILQYSYSSLEQKLEYLIEKMGREVGELLAFPAFLGYKLDDRIKIRFEERRKILGDGLSINKLLSVSTERFSARKRKNPLPS